MLSLHVQACSGSLLYFLYYYSKCLCQLYCIPPSETMSTLSRKHVKCSCPFLFRVGWLDMFESFSANTATSVHCDQQLDVPCCQIKIFSLNIQLSSFCIMEFWVRCGNHMGCICFGGFGGGSSLCSWLPSM